MKDRVQTSPNFRLGRNTNVLQTSGSLYIPTIRDISRNKEKQEKLPWKSHLGARPMHQSTFNLGSNQLSMGESIYNLFYEGSKHYNEEGRRPAKFPSLFQSQWEYGTNNKMNLNTLSQEMFPQKYVDTAPLHRTRLTNRNNNTSGTKMKSVTDVCIGQPNYDTNYRLSHSRASVNSTFRPNYRKSTHSYDVITGFRRAETRGSNYRRISGNRILSEARNAESLPRLLS